MSAKQRQQYNTTWLLLVLFVLGAFSILGVFRCVSFGFLQRSGYFQSDYAWMSSDVWVSSESTVPGSECRSGVHGGSQGSMASHHPTVRRIISDGLIPSVDTPPLQ